MTSWTTPRTWSSETMTSTLLNTHLRDDLNYLFENIHSGSGTAGWASYTPTFTNLTVGSGILAAKYAYAGKTTLWRVLLTFAADTTIAGTVSVSYPQTAVAYGTTISAGQLKMQDATGDLYVGQVFHASTTTATLKTYAVSGASIIEAALSSTVPFTWAINDQILIHGFYERA